MPVLITSTIYTTVISPAKFDGGDNTQDQNQVPQVQLEVHNSLHKASLPCSWSISPAAMLLSIQRLQLIPGV
jgi:hypothetical protein